MSQGSMRSRGARPQRAWALLVGPRAAVRARPTRVGVLRIGIHATEGSTAVWVGPRRRAGADVAADRAGGVRALRAVRGSAAAIPLLVSLEPLEYERADAHV